MQERRIKELLEIMLSHKECFEDGLCLWSTNLWCQDHITYTEKNILKSYIRKNRPPFYSSLDVLMHTADAYYWFSGNIKPRIKWIEKHIKLNS